MIDLGPTRGVRVEKQDGQGDLVGFTLFKAIEHLPKREFELVFGFGVGEFKYGKIIAVSNASFSVI